MCPLVTISCSKYGFVKRFSNLTDWGLNYTRPSRLDEHTRNQMISVLSLVSQKYSTASDVLCSNAMNYLEGLLTFVKRSQIKVNSQKGRVVAGRACVLNQGRTWSRDHCLDVKTWETGTGWGGMWGRTTQLKVNWKIQSLLKRKKAKSREIQRNAVTCRKMQ